MDEAAGDADDDFHGFTSFSGTSQDNSSGDFGLIASSMGAGGEALSKPEQNASLPCQTTQVTGAVGREFGGFCSPVGESTNESSQGQEHIIDTLDDGFGDFGVAISSPDLVSQSPSMKSQPPEPEIVADPHPNQQEDDWGDFGAFPEPAPSGGVINEAAEDGGSTCDDEEDNFGAFDDFTTSDNVKPTNLADHPPEPAAEDFEDFSTFEEPSPMVSDDEETRNASSLAQALLKKFGSEFAGLPGVWKEIIDTVESDMRRGIRILDYMSTKLSRADQSFIVKSDKLSNHILGLAEFLRVIRSIAASVGDLLGVDKSAELKESTLSEWHFEDIIVNAAVVENLYTDLISRAVTVGILSGPPAIPSVAEIRESNGGGTICHLTLQTTTEDKSTRSVVIWKDRPFMACSANFCANRLPTLDVLS